LDEDEEKKLFKKYIKTGDKAAFDKIVVSNLRFVIYMAKHFFMGLKTQYNCRDIHLDDLIQA
jgi:DNA-directed RNA polymerase sigma subunit (sigma70/sigma32)